MTIKRRSKDDGTVGTVKRELVLVLLALNYTDAEEALDRATIDSPVQTIGAFYWTEQTQ